MKQNDLLALAASILIFPGIAFAKSVPDGLCRLSLQNGSSGYGFVVGDTLFSSATVMQHRVSQVLCADADRLVDVSALMTGDVQFHSKFKNLGADTSSLDRSRINSVQYENIISFGNLPYDVAYQKLNKMVKSDFILDPSSSAKETEAVQSLAPNLEAEGITIFENGKTLRLETGGAFTVQSRFRSDRQTYEIFSSADPNWNDGNLYLEYDMKTKPAYAGSPLFYEYENGKFLVSGILSGQLPNPSPVKGFSQYDRVLPSIFTPTHELSKILRQSHPQFFMNVAARSCGKFLKPAHSIKSPFF